MAIMMAVFILLNTGVTRQIETFIVLVNFCQVRDEGGEKKLVGPCLAPGTLSVST